jgi:hypothetical protein
MGKVILRPLSSTGTEEGVEREQWRCDLSRGAVKIRERIPRASNKMIPISVPRPFFFLVEEQHHKGLLQDDFTQV